VRAFQNHGFDEVRVHVETENESAARGRNGDDRRDGEAENVPAPTLNRASASRIPRPLRSQGVDLFV
jgi:hypothetical protein